jgi:hypothetical protein
MEEKGFRKWVQKINNPRWGWLVSLALIFVGSFSGWIIRGFCLALALILGVIIFYDTEIAKGRPDSPHSKKKRLGRTGLAAAVMLVVAVFIFLGANRAETFAQQWHDNTSENHATPANKPATATQVASTQAPTIPPQTVPSQAAQITLAQNKRRKLKLNHPMSVPGTTTPSATLPFGASIVNNAGKIGEVDLRGNAVHSFSPNATIVNNQPTGEVKKVTGEKNTVDQLDDEDKTASTPTVFHLYNVQNAHISSGVVCGLNNDFVKTSGPTENLQIENTQINDPQVCAWQAFFISTCSHKDDIAAYLSAWESAQEREWVNLSDEMREKNIAQVRELKQRLSDAVQNNDDIRDCHDATARLVWSRPDFPVMQP